MSGTLTMGFQFSRLVVGRAAPSRFSRTTETIRRRPRSRRWPWPRSRYRWTTPWSSRVRAGSSSWASSFRPGCSALSLQGTWSLAGASCAPDTREPTAAAQLLRRTMRTAVRPWPLVASAWPVWAVGSRCRAAHRCPELEIRQRHIIIIIIIILTRTLYYMELVYNIPEIYRIKTSLIIRQCYQ